MNQIRKAEFFLIGVTVIWGGTFVSIKSALAFTTPLLLMGLRFFSAFLFFALIYRVPYKKIPRQTLIHGLFLGVLMFFGYGLQTIGLGYTTAARSGFITYLYAVLTPFFQFFIMKKKPFWGNLLGLCLALSGLYLITGGWSGGKVNLGDLITTGSAVAFSLYIVYLNILSKKNEPVFLTVIQLLVTSIMAFAFSPVFETPFLVSSGILWGNLLYLSLLGSVVAVFIMTRFQNFVTPTRSALLYSLEPLFSAIAAVLILHEYFSLKQTMGAILIMTGVLLSEILEIRNRRRKERLNSLKT